MEAVDSFLDDVKQSVARAVDEAREDRALLRSYILEEAEKKGDDVKSDVISRLGDFGKDTEPDAGDDDDFGFDGHDEKSYLEEAFKEKLEELIGKFYAEYVGGSPDKALQKAMIPLGESGKRNIEARLIVERKDRLSEMVKNVFHKFSTLTILGDRDIQKILREVDAEVLAKALKISSYEIQDKIFRNMSKRVAAMLREDMEYMGPVKREDVYEAQDKVVSIMSRLEENGEIIISFEGDSETV